MRLDNYADAGRSPRSRRAVGARRSRRLLSLRDTARAMSQENVEIVRRVVGRLQPPRRGRRCSTNSTPPRSSGTLGCRFSSAGKPPCTGGTKASARESENLKKPSLRSRQSENRNFGTLASESSPSATSGDAADSESSAITECAIAWIVEVQEWQGDSGPRVSRP